MDGREAICSSAMHTLVLDSTLLNKWSKEKKFLDQVRKGKETK